MIGPRDIESQYLLKQETQNPHTAEKAHSRYITIIMIVIINFTTTNVLLSIVVIKRGIKKKLFVIRKV